jgi:outer membrane autotransporter protein
VDGVLGYSDNDIDTKRSGNEGDTDADQFAAEVVIGAERLLDNGVEISPYGGLHYIRADVEGYTESGPSALAYEDQDSHTLYAVLGGEVSTERQTANGWVVWPKTYAELRAVVDDNDDDLAFALAAAPGSGFKQKVQPYDDYSVTLGLGIEGQRSESSSLYARVSATVGDEGSFDYSISAGANFRF